MAQCRCGSGQERRPLYDARQIFVAYVCDNCEPGVKAKFRPEIFTDANYDAPDLGDDEDEGC